MNNKEFLDLYSGAPKGLPLTLITVRSPSYGEFRFTDDNIKRIFGGKEYLPYSYKIEFPDESESSDNSGSITMAKTDDLITAALRKEAGDITLSIDAEYIPGDGSFVPLLNPAVFHLDSPVINKISVQAGLKVHNILSDAFPGHAMTPTTCPGIK